MPFPILAAAAAGTTIASGITSMFGSNETSGGYSLPPELEIQLLNDSQAGLEQVRADFDRLDQLQTVYNQRLDLLDRYTQGQLPPEQAVKELSSLSASIAKAFGGRTLDAVNRGFMDEDTARELEDLRQVESQDYKDPVLEGQLGDQRAQLEQDLARRGVGPAARLIALQRFDRAANEQRFTRTEELRTGKTQRAVARGGLRTQARQQGLSEAQTGLDVVSRELNRTNDLTGLLGNIGSGRFNVGQQGLAIRSGLRGERLATAAELGKYQFSNTANRALESGLLGPGTVRQQIGMDRNNLEAYRRYVKGYETQLGKDDLSRLPGFSNLNSREGGGQFQNYIGVGYDDPTRQPLRYRRR